MEISGPFIGSSSYSSNSRTLNADYHEIGGGSPGAVLVYSANSSNSPNSQCPTTYPNSPRILQVLVPVPFPTDEEIDDAVEYIESLSEDDLMLESDEMGNDDIPPDSTQMVADNTADCAKLLITSASQSNGIQMSNPNKGQNKREKQIPRANTAGKKIEEEFGPFESNRLTTMAKMKQDLGEKARNYELVTAEDLVLKKGADWFKSDGIVPESKKWFHQCFGVTLVSFRKDFVVPLDTCYEVFFPKTQSGQPVEPQWYLDILANAPKGYEIFVKEMKRQNSRFKGIAYEPIKGLKENDMFEKYGWDKEKRSRRCPQSASLKSLALGLLTLHTLPPAGAKWAIEKFGKFWKVFFVDLQEFEVNTEEDTMENLGDGDILVNALAASGLEELVEPPGDHKGCQMPSP